MLNFADRPDNVRMELRAIIEAHTGIVEGYYGPDLQVILPADADRRAALSAALATRGFAMVDGSRYWFPACNNEPANVLRWKRNQDVGNRSAAYVEFARYAPPCRNSPAPAGWTSVETSV